MIQQPYDPIVRQKIPASLTDLSNTNVFINTPAVLWAKWSWLLTLVIINVSSIISDLQIALLLKGSIQIPAAVHNAEYNTNEPQTSSILDYDGQIGGLLVSNWWKTKTIASVIFETFN